MTIKAVKCIQFGSKTINPGQEFYAGKYAEDLIASGDAVKVQSKAQPAAAAADQAAGGQDQDGQDQDGQDQGGQDQGGQDQGGQDQGVEGEPKKKGRKK
jgi:hypothetical protein